MIQVIFIALLLVTLLAGTVTYFFPSAKPFNPMQFLISSSGYQTLETSNRKKSQEFNVVNSKGLMKVRRKIDEVALAQDQFLLTVQDQQRLLRDAHKNIQDLLRSAQKEGRSKDILQLQALSDSMESQERLLISRGQYIVGLNNRLSKLRALLAEDADLANADTETARSSMKDRYALLSTQADDLFEKINEHRQEMSDSMNDISGKISTIPNAHMQNISDNMQRVMDKQQEAMTRLADSRQTAEDSKENAQLKMADSKEKSDDAIQQARDLMERQRQMQQDRLK